jgi:hypothetical protein
MLRRLAAPYFGGAVGAMFNSLAIWIAGRAGLTAAIGVSLAPKLTWPWLENRLLWGSLWALGYPLVRRRFTPVRAGLVLSLAPSLAQLFWFFPEAGHGMLGVAHGPLTPVVVLVVNGIWGWVLARVVLTCGSE